MRFVFVVCVLPVLWLPAAAQHFDSLSYGPAIVTVSGVVVRDTFPGPPNFESVSRGDEAEAYWVLELAMPVYVRPSSDEGAEDSVSRMQLVFKDVADYDKYRLLLGNGVNVTGTLMHAMSAHHHTKVLIIVKNMVAE